MSELKEALSGTEAAALTCQGEAGLSALQSIVASAKVSLVFFELKNPKVFRRKFDPPRG